MADSIAHLGIKVETLKFLDRCKTLDCEKILTDVQHHYAYICTPVSLKRRFQNAHMHL